MVLFLLQWCAWQALAAGLRRHSALVSGVRLPRATDTRGAHLPVDPDLVTAHPDLRWRSPTVIGGNSRPAARANLNEGGARRIGRKCQHRARQQSASPASELAVSVCVVLQRRVLQAKAEVWRIGLWPGSLGRASKGLHVLATSGICIILNAGSGKRDAKSEPDAITEAFAAQGSACTIKLVEDGAQIEAHTRAAVAEGFTTIVAAGGDGTICGVASALRGSKTMLGILPSGTFNYFARSLDLPMDLEPAVKVIVEAHSRALRIATINGQVFLNNASLGAYPAILESREDIYKRWGRSRIAAYWAVIKTLSTVRPPLHLRITADGDTRSVRSPLVFVVNNAYQLTQLALEGAEHIKNGKLVVFVAPDAGRMEMIRMAVRIAFGRGLPEWEFAVFGGADILIERLGRGKGHRQTIARDGERERLAGPFRLQVVENALTVLVPQTDTGATR